MRLAVVQSMGTGMTEVPTFPLSSGRVERPLQNDLVSPPSLRMLCPVT